MAMTLHVEVVGHGPPLVLLHGWAMHGGVFEPLVARLRDRFTLHVVDLPGHGLSRDVALPPTLPACADAVAEAIAALAPVAPWCGWSLGGLVALQAAATLPRQVPALAMLCASPRFVRGADWAHGISADLLRDFVSGLRSDYRGTLERFVALEAFGSDQAKDEIRVLRDSLFARGEPAAQGLADGLALLQASDLRDCLPGLAVPSLWLAGRRDRLVAARAMAAAAALAPRAQFALVEHAGHAPFLTHADVVAARLAEFFQAASAGQAGSHGAACRRPAAAAAASSLQTRPRRRGNDQQPPP